MYMRNVDGTSCSEEPARPLLKAAVITMVTDKDEPDFVSPPPPLVAGVINCCLGDAQKEEKKQTPDEKITSETSTFLLPPGFDWTYSVYFSELLVKGE